MASISWKGILFVVVVIAVLVGLVIYYNGTSPIPDMPLEDPDYMPDFRHWF